MRRFWIAMTIVCVLLTSLPAAKAAVCTVTNLAGDMATPGSFGSCVAFANLNLGPDTIVFQIMTSIGPHTILAEQEYYFWDAGTTVDGFSQLGSAPNVNPIPQALNTRLAISISGEAIADFSVAVLRIEADDTTLRGLNVHSGPVYDVTIGLEIQDIFNSRIHGCFIGTDVTGTLPRPSGRVPYNPPYAIGVYVTNGATGTIIGTDWDGFEDNLERNLISGEIADAWMAGHGVAFDNLFGSDVTDSWVIGNLIGTTFDPRVPLGNNYGVTFLGGSRQNNVLSNVIAGNFVNGVFAGSIFGNGLTQDNIIRANAIGIDPNTNTPVGNFGDGIRLASGCENFMIGGTDWNEANIISGNGGHGVHIAIDGNGTDSTGNLVDYNLIGLDISGAFTISNGGDGILLENTRGGNQIGTGGAGNVVSGNAGHGIHLTASDNNTIAHNIIGVNFAGDTAQPNGLNGITLDCSGFGSCSDSNDVFGNGAFTNWGSGLALLGPLSSNQLTANTSAFNGENGLVVLLADDTNQVNNGVLQGNNLHGAELVGTTVRLNNNDILSNRGLGVFDYPWFGADTSPLSAGDDVVGEPRLNGNLIDDNDQGGIYSLDNEPRNGDNLHNTNTIGYNGGLADVVQAWFGAVEILDSGFNPIGAGAYTVSLASDFGLLQSGDVPAASIWGPTGFDANDVFTWFQLVDYLVDVDGVFFDGNPHDVAAVGPTGGTSVYTFDGVLNDTDLGGQPSGIPSGGLLRYQLAEVVTDADSDGDGVGDSVDCAPSDPMYQGAAGVPCDADGDGFCDAAIVGVVQQADCPRDICAATLCTPTDCLDSDGTVNPGVVEQAFGDPECSDGLDNDCDTDVDGADSGCVQCNNDADCADGDLCNGIEVCLAGVCGPGTALVCDDSNPCTDDSCDPFLGCQVDNNADPCDDGLVCTEGDTCTGGACLGRPLDCTGLGDACNNGVCEEAAGGCTTQPVPDGSICDDGDACTMNDACTAGSCDGVTLDGDGDGFGDLACGGTDCDDSDASIYPGAPETCDDGIDQDCNGSDLTCGCADADGDTYEDTACGGTDCNDADAAVNPGAAEDCGNGVDDDCDGDVDLADSECVVCPDADGDGYDDLACGGTDCDDTDPAINPGATEDCLNGIDDDCDGDVDTDPECTVCPDIDGDGFQDETCGGTDCDDTDEDVNPDAAEVECDSVDNDCDPLTVDDPDPTDGDGDGHSVGCGDCDDADPGINPDAVEICDDTIDQDCNGADLQCGCADADGDGFEDAACGGSDCDDVDAAINPDATETDCDGIDNDCNPATVDDTDSTDADGDGYTIGCGADCDDGDPAINPDAAEDCGDAVDNDCDGDVDGDDAECACADADGDGYGDTTCGGTDCDDTDSSINPGAAEVCDDSVDNDCDGDVDATDSDCTTCADADGDGFDDEACGGTDCDDTDAAINPTASEVCDDSVDNDCDGLADGDDSECACVDADGDTYGDEACGGTDCDDGVAAINPGATEDCGNGLDDDCDGLVDDFDEDCVPQRSGGCGCATYGGRLPGLALAFFLLGLVLLRRRRR